jgi:phosphoglycolate phosphatase-like HAD superfamily hydrolase
VTDVLIDLDGALADTRPLWQDWLRDSARVLGVDPADLPADRGAVATALDEAGAGNWRTLLKRYAEDRAPLHFRPASDVGATLRRLASAGVRLGVFSDAPQELAEVALDHLGATRRVTALEAGSGALERLQERLEPGAAVIRTRQEFVGFTS